MNRVSILGCGWLGLPLGKTLAQAGYEVRGSTTQQDKLKQLQPNGIKPYLIDCNNTDLNAEDFFDAEILVITIPPSNVSKAEDYFKQLELIETHITTSSIQHTIFISSTSVYPNLQREVEEPDASYDALTRSGISLLKAEDIFRNETNTIIRFAGLIGPDRYPKWFAGKKDLSGGEIPVNMIHLDDCIEVIKAVIESAHWGETFNACAPEHPVKKVYYPKWSEILKLEPPTYKVDPSTEWKIVSSRKLISELDYKFQKSVYDV